MIVVQKRKRKFKRSLTLTDRELKVVHKSRPFAEYLYDASRYSEDVKRTSFQRCVHYERRLVILACNAFPNIGPMWLQFLTSGDVDDNENNYMDTKTRVWTIRKYQGAKRGGVLTLSVPLPLTSVVESLYSLRRADNPLPSTYVFVRSVDEPPTKSDISTAVKAALGKGMTTKIVNKLHGLGIWGLTGFDGLLPDDKDTKRRKVEPDGDITESETEELG